MKFFIFLVVVALGLNYIASSLSAPEDGKHKKKQTLNAREQSSQDLLDSQSDDQEGVVVAPKPTVKRLAFVVSHRGITPRACNLVFRENGVEIVPEDMLLHDYLKRSDGAYYFAVSMDKERFLLKASDIVKEKCSKSDLSMVFKFAKYCKSKDRPMVKATPVEKKEEVDPYAISEKEEAHIRNGIKSISLRGDFFRQRGTSLKIYKQYKRQGRKAIFEKTTGSYWVVDGTIPETYRVPTRSGYRTVTVTSATLWKTITPGGTAYCTSQEMAYYYAVCEHFSTVKRKFYKGPKPSRSRAAYK